MKTVFVSAYVGQNLGDDLFVECLCNRYSHVSFYIVCDNRYAQAFKSINNLTILDNKECLSKLCSDLHIIIGGSIFMQSSTKSILEKYESDENLVIPNVPTYIIGANFGPYSSEEFLLLYKKWFKTINGIVFRDKYSFDLFKYGNMSWAPDILFNYKLPKFDITKKICISCIKKNSRSGLSTYDEDAYLRKLTELSTLYSSLGFEIILASFSTVQEDNIAASMIFNNLTPDVKSKTKQVEYRGNTHHFLKEILSCEYIIGTRFHSIILGWHANIPTFPICYNEKLSNALDSYGFVGNSIDIDKISSISFDFIDFNRTNRLNTDSRILAIESEKHFLTLDTLLME